ncbi:MAG: hypothetical protein H8E37_10100 [Planctomycetes bacterium]|nr:hypothetical protein [Planctomycetota bacterium]
MPSFAAANWFGDDEGPQELSPEHPFLLLGQDEPEPFGSLEEAIRRADNGSTIELHTNDPIELSGFDLDRDIVIRAAPGMRPVLVFRPGPDGHDVLFATDSHLSLEGLEVHVEPRSEDERLTAIEIHGAELRIIHCQIMNPSGTGIVADEAQRIVIEDTEIQCPREAAIACDLAAGGQLEIRTSFLTGQDPLRMSVFADDVEVQLIDTALLGRHAVAVESEFDVDSDEARHVDFVAHRTAFLSAGEPLLLVAEEMPDGEAVAKVIEWEGRENTWQARGVVDDPAPMIGVDIEDDEFDIPDWSPETLEEWRELSSVTEEDSLWGDETRSAHFDEAFDLIERGDFIPRELMLRDHSCDE